MNKENQTVVTEIVLLGFQVLHEFRTPYFLLFLTLYTVTLFANLMIITLVSVSPNLRQPMFFLLGHLSMTDIVLATNIVPNMLRVILRGRLNMSFTACIVQLTVSGTSLSAECLLLAVMSYDRYLAICNPLHYKSTMGAIFCLLLVCLCWLFGFLISFVTVLLVSQLRFCGPKVIGHFCCDLLPVLQLSCSDITMLQIEITLLGAPVTLFPVVFIVITYICICNAILKIPSMSGRHKTFSTCSSHLAVVGIFYGTLITLYVIPSHGQLLDASKILSLLYTVGTPLFNPLIYSLRNKQIRVALDRFLTGKWTAFSMMLR
ncbi:olfactory receptor 11H4-like [Pelodytes ibericus]